MSDKQQQLVLSIIEFLNRSLSDGTVKQDDKEGLEVAVQCIGEAFGVDPNDQEQCDRLSIKPATLPTIFDVFLKTKEKVGAGGTQAPPLAASTSSDDPSSEDKAKAEKLKQLGNSQMSNKQYDQAIDSYTQAIALNSTNAVFYSNRAAAHTSKGDHLSAIVDAEQAITVDPSFTKAYHRLGHARYSIGDYEAAASAFRRGLEQDPTSINLKSGLQNAESRISEGADSNDHDDKPEARSSAPPAGAGMGNMADMLRQFGGGGPGGGGARGMPDLASIMNNPMMMQMAQQMMANGGAEKLMQNPAVASMMDRVQSGGSMPTMDELMNDPSLRNLASQFGGGSR